MFYFFVKAYTFNKARNPSPTYTVSQEGKFGQQQEQNNQLNSKQRLRLDRLRNSTWDQATTQNILLQKSGKKLKKHY